MPSVAVNEKQWKRIRKVAFEEDELIKDLASQAIREFLEEHYLEVLKS